MDRKEEILSYLKQNNGDDLLLESVVDEFVFLETRLEELKKLPFIKIHPTNPERQKTTPAAKQYKELLQQYTNLIKVIVNLSGVDDEDDESPLGKWIKNNLERIGGR